MNRPAITPMMEQYLRIKSTVSDKLLFYRMGDFYELFLDDAIEASKILDITLTSRGQIEGKAVKMCGVPFHAAEQYILRLVKAGKSIAICEQVGEVGAKRGPVERKVVKIITPGTLTDSAFLPEKKTIRILSVAYSKKECALAWLSLESGEFKTKKINYEELEDELQRLSPAEILLEDSRKIHLPHKWQNKVTYINEWHFDAQSAFRIVCDFYQVQDLMGFGLTLKDQPLLVSSIGALLNYIDLTQKTIPKHLDGLSQEFSETTIVLDASTRRNLEILETLSGKREPTLFSHMDVCSTNMGSRLLASWLSNPLRNHELISKRHEAVRCLLTSYNFVLDFLDNIVDIERIIARISLGSARPRDLSSLRDSLILLTQFEWNNYPNSSLLQTVLDFFPQGKEISIFLQQSILAEPSIWIRDGGVINDGFNEELDELRQLSTQQNQILQELEAKEKENTALSTLKIEFNRVQGFYIELSKKEAEFAPGHYIRKQTLKNVERFITEELKSFEEKILHAEQSALLCEKKLFDDVLHYLQQNIPLLQQIARAVSTLDVLASFAKIAKENNYCQPEWMNYPVIDIEDGWHPVVFPLVDHFTNNDCELNENKKFMLITGPNMGGKSTFMRQTAIIVLLSHIGSYAPAKKVKLGPIDRIFTRIGSSDDIASNRSTFMVEMSETAYILNHATHLSLVLVDEVGRGTSTSDGSILAHSIATFLIKKNRSFTLFSTHYFELTILAEYFSSVINMHLTAVEDKDNIVFLHKVEPGPATKSYGIAVAKLAGIPSMVIQQAKKMMIQMEKHELKNKAQMDIFSSMPTEEQDEIKNEKDQQILDRLAELNPDNLSPKEALEQLYLLKNILLSDEKVK